MKRLTVCIGAAVFALSGCAGARQQSASPEALIRLHLAYEAQAPGTHRMEAVGSGNAYFVAGETVISDEHIETARVVETPGGLTVDLRLTERGALRLREATGSHIGERLAIVIGSRLMSAPIIRAELDSPLAALGLTLPPDEARAVAAAIGARFESGD